jgi:hypothetical protein
MPAEEGAGLPLFLGGIRKAEEEGKAIAVVESDRFATEPADAAPVAPRGEGVDEPRDRRTREDEVRGLGHDPVRRRRHDEELVDGLDGLAGELLGGAGVAPFIEITARTHDHPGAVHQLEELVETTAQLFLPVPEEGHRLVLRRDGASGWR